MCKKILFISPTFPYPLTTGNRVRIQELLLTLKELGHEVHFLYINTEPFDQNQVKENSWSDKVYVAPYKSPHKTFLKRAIRKIKRILNHDSAFTYSIDGLYDPSLNQFIASVASQADFDVVIVLHVFFSKALEFFNDKVLKIIDTMDVFTNRHTLYLRHKQLPHWYSTTVEEEAKGLNRADIIIAIQNKEKEFFSKLTSKKIVVVGHKVDLKKPIQSSFNTKIILCIGASNPMNIRGINFFIQEIFPLIRSRFPDARLLLAGTICDEIEDCEACIRLGKVEDLQAVYDLANVVINPVPYGTGLKIKTIEALGYSKPLVTTSVGADGLEDGKGKAFLVGDTPEEFVDAIVTIFSDAKVAENLAMNAYEFAKKWNEENLRTLASILD
jgi:polysaccharide biosynthesis protein PslH